jgi:hypothetical protein
MLNSRISKVAGSFNRNVNAITYDDGYAVKTIPATASISHQLWHDDMKMNVLKLSKISSLLQSFSIVWC